MATPAEVEVQSAPGATAHDPPEPDSGKGSAVVVEAQQLVEAVEGPTNKASAARLRVAIANDVAYIQRFVSLSLHPTSHVRVA